MSHADPKEVFVANVHPALEVDQSRVRKAALAVLQREGKGEGRVNIVLATDQDLADLNAKYRGRDGPTDVLSFPMGGDEYAVQEEHVLGEVYVSLDRARQQAKEYKVSFAEEVDRLVIHGTLHLFGYDHEDDGDARQMETKERDFLETFR